MNLAESKFLKSLRALARVAGRDLNADGMELYKLLVLDAFGDEAAERALLAWVQQNQRSAFPTPGELLAILQPEASPKSQASELAARVLGCIARRGHVWPQTFHYEGHATFRDALEKELGAPVAAFVERVGGWVEVCRQFGGTDSPAALRAQLRDSLESVVVEQSSAKLLGEKKPVHEIAQKRGGEMVPVSALVKRGVA